MNFDTVKDNDVEKSESFHTVEYSEFKFARPKCPVGGKLAKSSSGRTLSDPSPQVISSLEKKLEERMPLELH